MPVAFGPYLLQALLGEGASAKVFRGTKQGAHGVEKQVAIKVLHPSSTVSDKIILAFRDEARIGGLLRHDNIVGTYEFEKVGAQYCLVMEYVDGWTLHDFLTLARGSRRYIPTTVVIDILVQICQGLAFAHSLEIEGVNQGVVHRDLKPANILVTRHGEVKVADFGIAKHEQRDSPKTTIGITRGTPLYMSPEQVCGDDLDGRSDIFALGSILFELCTLNPAFSMDSVEGILNAIINVDLEELGKKLDRLAPELVWLLSNCLSPKLSERYDHVSQMRDDLLMVSEQLEGPSLDQWIDYNLDGLFSEIPDGNFGEDGPPPAIAPTETLESISIFSRPIDEAEPPPEDRLTILEAPGVRGVPVTRTLMTRSPSGTNAEWARGESLDVPQTVHAVATLSRVTSDNPIPERPLEEWRNLSAPLTLLVIVALVLIGGMVAVGIMFMDPAPLAPTSPVTTESPAATPDTLPDIEPTPEPEVWVEPGGAPTPTGRISNPKSGRASISRSEPTPDLLLEEPEPTPVVAQAPAFIMMNAKYPSEIMLDGGFIGTTPIVRYETLSGKHKATIRCVPCDVPTQATITFELAPGQFYRYVETFPDQVD